ncbi:MAG TPA: CsbD family protein [Pyrinomonadaceae bacterium]|nr:CsbD family protein [Pyrinomonadaceae bacterium]
MRYEGELKGKAKQVKGRVKEGLGKATGDRAMHDEGERERVEGKVQEGVSHARRVFGDAVEDIGDQIASG